MTTLLKDFADESDLDLRVLYTTDLTSKADPGAGERKLADGQDSSLNNTYVIYVGSDSPLPDAPDLGFAHQAFQGENNEFGLPVLANAPTSAGLIGSRPFRLSIIETSNVKEFKNGTILV